jgi:hypothetical protein
MTLATYDHDHVERRGRPRKERPAGTVTVRLDLPPDIVALIERIKASNRTIRGGGVPSRSEIIHGALRAYESVNDDGIERTRLLIDRRLDPAIRVLRGWYHRDGIEIDNNWQLIRRVLQDAARAVSR